MDKPVKLPVFSRSTLPDPKLYFDCLISVLETDMQTRTTLISNGVAWVGLGGGGGGTWGSITGALSAQTDLETALGLKANAANPAFSGTATGTMAVPATITMVATPTQADDSLKIATTAYVDTGLATKATIGQETQTADIIAGRAITAADFAAGIMMVNSASVLPFTLPTVAAMGLAGSGNVLAVRIMGTGIPTFAGATASTTINGTAGTTVATPVGTPVQFSTLLFEQVRATNAWTLG